MGSSPNGQSNPTSGGMMVAPPGRTVAAPPAQGPIPPSTQVMAMNKAPSAIKTNIKLLLRCILMEDKYL